MPLKIFRQGALEGVGGVGPKISIPHFSKTRRQTLTKFSTQLGDPIALYLKR